MPMEASTEAFLKAQISREIVELLKVKEQLKMSNEAGSLPGDKANWCINKISDITNDLGHISSIFGAF